MKLTSATVYAIRAVAFLAGQADNPPTPSVKIAEATGTPNKFLTKVLQPLVKIGVLAAATGPGGGYRLAKPAKDISVLEVVEASQGPVGGDLKGIDGHPLPALEKALQEAVEGAKTILGKATMADLAVAGNGSGGKKRTKGKAKVVAEKEGE